MGTEMDRNGNIVHIRSGTILKRWVEDNRFTGSGHYVDGDSKAVRIKNRKVINKITDDKKIQIAFSKFDFPSDWEISFTTRIINRNWLLIGVWIHTPVPYGNSDCFFLNRFDGDIKMKDDCIFNEFLTVRPWYCPSLSDSSFIDRNLITRKGVVHGKKDL